MSRITFKTLVLVLGVLFSVNLLGQSKYGTGEDSTICLKNLSLYRQYYKQGPSAYKDAVMFWRIAVDKCPKSSKNLYIHGPKMYKEFIKKEKDATKRGLLLDTLLSVYDLRTQHFGNAVSNGEKKGSDIMRYAPSRFEEAFPLLKKAFETKKAKTKSGSLGYFFTAAVKMFQAGKMTKEEAVVLYAQISEVLDKRIAAENSASDIQAKKAIDEMLLVSIKPDCSTMVNIYKPDYDPKNADLLKKIIGSLEKECQDEQLYVQAVKDLIELEPSAIAYRNFARMMKKRGDISAALSYYKKAIELEEDPKLKSSDYLDMAFLTHKSSPSTAFSYANSSIANDASKGKAYLMKARLIAKGAGDCAKGKEQAAYYKSCVYWVAVDMCEKAKAVDPSVAAEANKLIKSYSASFPGKEQIFFQGDKEGAKKTIECWFTATTTIRAK